MAEATGLAKGAAGVAALSNTCVQCSDLVETGPNYTRDHKLLHQVRLLVWGEAAELRR